MKIAILGPGAIGSLVGSLLYKTGNEVIFLCKESTKNLINHNGINIKSSVYGDFTIHPCAVVNSSDIFDVIFITVKAYDLPNALKTLSGNIGENTIIISLLNGIGHEKVISQLPTKNILIGTIGAVEVSLDENRNIIHSSNGIAHIELASDINSSNSSVFLIENLLKKAGFSVNILKNKNEVIWRKLVRLSALSILTSIARKPLGKVLENSELNLLMKNVVCELCSVAETQEININAEVVIDQIESLPDRLTTSMQRDIQSGKESEIDAILLNPIKLGQATGLNLPYLEECYSNLVKSSKI